MKELTSRLASKESMGGALDQYRDWLVSRLSEQTGGPHLLVDVSEIARVDYGGGIQRVTNRLLGELLFSPPRGYRVLPVCVTDNGSYVHARKFLCTYLGVADGSLGEDEPVEVSTGDHYLGLDLIRDRAELARPALSAFGDSGAHISFVVYDLLPHSHPQWFPPGIDAGFNQWLRLVADVADTALCISRSVGNELRQALQAMASGHMPPTIMDFPLGADFGGWAPEQPVLGDLPGDIEARFLMVGTVERRKGHAKALDAFERLWADGRRVQLVIAGKPGWLVENLQERLRQHRLRGDLLHWFESPDDQTLVGLYRESTALLAASEGEGFGLPLAEAAWQGLPILAHDLPVFREVAGGGADYYRGDAAELAMVLHDYVDRAARGQVANPGLSRPCSWQESAASLLGAIGLPATEEEEIGIPAKLPNGSMLRHAREIPDMKDPIDIDALMQSIREELASSPRPSSDAASPSPETVASVGDRYGPPHLSADEIMQRVRAEVTRRRGDVPAADPEHQTPLPPEEEGSTVPESAAMERAALAEPNPAEAPTLSTLHRWEPVSPRLVDRPQYVLADLLGFNDEDFVDTAYRVLLRREAEAGERNHYLQALRNSWLSKVEILASIRWSEEGRAHGVHVDGLLAPYLVQRAQRWPLVGPLLGWMVTWARLPALRRRLNQIDAAQGWEIHALGRRHNRLAENVEAKLAMLSARLEEQERAAAAERADKAGQLQELHTLTSQMREQLHLLDARTRRLLDLEAVVVAQGTRLGDLEHNVGEDVASLAARVESGEQRGKQLEATLAEVRNGLAAGLESLGARIDAEVADLATRLESESHRGDQVEASLADVRNGLAAGVEALGVRIDAEIAGLAARIDAADHQAARLETVEGQLPGLHEALGQLLATGANLRQEADSLREMLSTKVDHDEIARLLREVADLRFSGVELQRRFGVLLEEARRRLPAELEPDQLQKFASEGAHRLDAMYANFEEDFRGTRENIMDRARHYLEPVTSAGAGSPEAPVLDLGCGRGEWLDLLKAQGLTGRGVDLNDVFIAQCRSRGLDVVESDVLAYLRDLPDASVGAITSMHLVEHLPLSVLVDLLDEAMRVLRPGGLIALETPNPENLLVGAHYFYMDPTHRNPLPPALLQWLVAARGFEQTRVDRLSEHRGAPGIDPVDASVPGAAQINTFVELLRTAPDYAVVAIKPARSTRQGAVAVRKKKGRKK